MQPDVRVFLAAPFAQWLTDEGVVDETRRIELTQLRRGFLDLGLPVFSAHHNERWGAGWLPAQTCVPNDFRAMQTCDVVCAYLGAPASSGVCIELGWASAMHKPVLLVLDAGAGHSQMIEGLSTTTCVRTLTVDGGIGGDSAARIVAGTVELAAACAPHRRTAWRTDVLDDTLGYVRGAVAFADR